MGLGNACKQHGKVRLRIPKLLGRYEFDSYYLDRIDAVEFTKGAFRGRIQVTTANDDGVVKGMDSGEGKRLAKHLQKVILDNQRRSKASPTAQEAQPLDVLKVGLVNGEITQEEYEKLRKVVAGAVMHCFQFGGSVESPAAGGCLPARWMGCLALWRPCNHEPGGSGG